MRKKQRYYYGGELLLRTDYKCNVEIVFAVLMAYILCGTALSNGVRQVLSADDVNKSSLKAASEPEAVNLKCHFDDWSKECILQRARKTGDAMHSIDVKQHWRTKRMAMVKPRTFTKQKARIASKNQTQTILKNMTRSVLPKNQTRTSVKPKSKIQIRNASLLFNATKYDKEVERRRLRAKALTGRFRTKWRLRNFGYDNIPICENATENVTTPAPPPPTIGVTKIPLSPEDIEMLLAEHNAERRKVDPTATDMRFMTWDPLLAWVSEAKTNSCEFHERSAFRALYTGKPMAPIRRHGPINAEIGYNWYAWKGINFLPADFVPEVMQAWVSEKIYYDFDTMRCSAVCRHYLQIIWARTFKVGCFASHCANFEINGINWPDSTILVCAYTPRGNVVEYLSPLSLANSYLTPPLTRPPYTIGPTCRDCGKSDDDSWGQPSPMVPSKRPTVDPEVGLEWGEARIRPSPGDYCEKKLCRNPNRDKEIPFDPLLPSTTTVFSWTTTLVGGTPPVDCIDPNQIGIQSGGGNDGSDGGDGSSNSTIDPNLTTVFDPDGSRGHRAFLSHPAILFSYLLVLFSLS